MEKIRLLEIAYESLSEHEPLRRAVIEVRNQQGKGAVNTVMIFTVKRPCVQLGEFQDIDEELHIQECRDKGVDISRRVGGGGCLFYDRRTCFAVALLHRGFFADLEEAAKIWQGEVITGILRSLGAKEAWYRHIGDVQIGQTKVSGLGAAYIQETLYLGSFMNVGTPQVELALKVLKIPPEKFADKPVSQLEDYVTSVEKVTGRMPTPAEFREAVTQNVERSLGVAVIPGEITLEEKSVYERLRPFYTSPEWIFKRSSVQKFAGLAPGYRKGKSRYKARKLIIAQVAIDHRNRIDRVMLCGDFFVQPSETLEEIENSLRGVEAAEEGKIFSAVQETLERRKAQIPMLTAEDLTHPLTWAVREALASPSVAG